MDRRVLCPRPPQESHIGTPFHGDWCVCDGRGFFQVDDQLYAVIQRRAWGEKSVIAYPCETCEGVLCKDDLLSGNLCPGCEERLRAAHGIWAKTPAGDDAWFYPLTYIEAVMEGLEAASWQS